MDRERTVELSVSLYTDVSCENAYSGQECGTVEVSVYYTDGSMAYLRGYLQKDSEMDTALREPSFRSLYDSLFGNCDGKRNRKYQRNLYEGGSYES